MATSGSGLRLRFSTDAAEFLGAATDHLAADPVVSTVVTTAANRALSAGRTELGHRAWWLVVHDASGTVVGAGMRTASTAPYPPFLLPMPGAAAVALAWTWHERHEEVLALNGALPVVTTCAAELARLGGGRVEVAIDTRLYELGELVPPPPAAGRLVAATMDHAELVTRWMTAFSGDADEQAGRPRNGAGHVPADHEETLGRLRDGLLWLWVDAAGRPVQVTGVNPPAFGVARVSLVYTPPEERGKGWASNALAEVSRRLRSEGSRVCLVADQANPASNRVYTALGFRRVVDMAHLRIAR